MSLLDSIFGGSSDSSVGNQILTAYFNETVQYTPATGYTDYASWIGYYNSIIPDFESFVGNLVNQNYASTTVGQAQARLVSLADQSQGTATLPQIIQAAGGKGDTVNWLAAIPAVTIDTTQQVVSLAAQVAQNVGTGVIGTLNTVQYLPWILGGALAIYLVSLGKSTGKSISRLADASSEALGGKE